MAPSGGRQRRRLHSCRPHASLPCRRAFHLSWRRDQHPPSAASAAAAAADRRPQRRSAWPRSRGSPPLLASSSWQCRAGRARKRCGGAGDLQGQTGMACARGLRLAPIAAQPPLLRCAPSLPPRRPRQSRPGSAVCPRWAARSHETLARPASPTPSCPAPATGQRRCCTASSCCWGGVAPGHATRRGAAGCVKTGRQAAVCGCPSEGQSGGKRVTAEKWSERDQRGSCKRQGGP